jgi:hypothetical protein
MKHHGRPARRRAKKASIAVSEKGNEVLWDLVKTWRGVAARLKSIAERQGRDGEYIAAAQNDWFGAGISGSAEELAAVLPEQPAALTFPEGSAEDPVNPS